MEDNLQHEDLLIKLRGKLNEEKIKLWEPPYLGADDLFTQSFQELAKKYASDLSLDEHLVLTALHELQLRSMERVKANEEFKDTGLATFRIKVTIPKEKPKMLKIQKTLDVPGSDLLNAVAAEIGVAESRLKLISNGKLVKSNMTLNEQNVKNGTQLMALVLDASPDEVKKEDNLYIEMKTTRDDATMLSEYVSQLADYDEYMKLEDQSGKAVELPPAEKKSLLVGLALHERGRAAIKQKDYSLALVLLLEADRQFNECRSSLLQTVDNWGVLQLDIAWCYAGLRSVAAAADAARRLAAAERALRDTYGPDQRRLLELKGNAANERVLLMRLYLLQGIVAFHQNRRADAKDLLEKAEAELNNLRVDESAVSRLMELGWSRAQARVGLRGASGDPDRAHLQLAARADQREQHRRDRRLRLQRTCSDGSALDGGLVRQLEAQGFARPLAAMALRHNNNDLQAALRDLTSLREHPQLLFEMLDQVVDSDSDSPSEPDNKLIAELEGMGYSGEMVRRALRAGHNELHAALDLLLAGHAGRAGHAGHAATSESRVSGEEEGGNPSTSTAETSRTKLKQEWERKKECDRALERLSSAIRGDEDDYLDTSLMEEEQYLAEYKSLL
ncbi:PREDICTED: NEDD8 ultimate buster 1-like [Papilio xuthus]|uniref:NEDD8 ultimate buster 1-like n=1 Tax=Papilio xuthus TaxID=66420 RepID=A0AAJ6ZG44_PAPXU|nr:PREDICTED: NEDD8 ultimate buster 1-like [Papilio xuthus]